MISVARARHGTVRARLTIVLGKKRRVVAHVVLGSKLRALVVPRRYARDLGGEVPSLQVALDHQG